MRQFKSPNARTGQGQRRHPGDERGGKTTGWYVEPKITR
jgi:hypothetical protein